MTQDQLKQAEQLTAIKNECALAVKMLESASNQLATIAELSSGLTAITMQDLDNRHIQATIDSLNNYIAHTQGELDAI